MVTNWYVVHGDHWREPPNNFMGSDLRDPTGKLFAFCSPFDNPEPLELAAELLNIGVIIPETAEDSLLKCPGVYVVQNIAQRFGESVAARL